MHSLKAPPPPSGYATGCAYLMALFFSNYATPEQPLTIIFFPVVVGLDFAPIFT